MWCGIVEGFEPHAYDSWANNHSKILSEIYIFVASGKPIVFKLIMTRHLAGESQLIKFIQSYFILNAAHVIPLYSKPSLYRTCAFTISGRKTVRRTRTSFCTCCVGSAGVVPHMKYFVSLRIKIIVKIRLTLEQNFKTNADIWTRFYEFSLLSRPVEVVKTLAFQTFASK